MIKIDNGAIWYQKDPDSLSRWICGIDTPLFKALTEFFKNQNDVDVDTVNVSLDQIAEYYRRGYKDGWKDANES